MISNDISMNNYFFEGINAFKNSHVLSRNRGVCEKITIIGLLKSLYNNVDEHILLFIYCISME